MNFTKEHLNIMQSICEPFRVSMGVVFRGYQENGFFLISGYNAILTEIIENPDWWYLHGVNHVSQRGIHEFKQFTTQKCDEMKQLLQEIQAYCGYIPTVFVPPHNDMAPDWLPFLIERGIHILSSSKRHSKKNLEFWSSRQVLPKYMELEHINGKVPCGILNEGKLVEIPQTIMLRLTDFLSNPNNYVNFVCNLIQSISEHCQVVVLTLHWWEFIGDTQTQVAFSMALRQLFSILHMEGFESCSFNDASRIKNLYWADAKVFDDFYGMFAKKV